MSDVRCPKDMVYIPEGKFEMGSTNGDSDEQPVRNVFEPGLCMDKHEVTNAQYSSYSPPKSPKGFDRPDQPVVKVSWYGADGFCATQGKRLPTEAEWEKAARGPEGFEYGTRSGELNHDEVHYDTDSTNATADVCSYPENGYGLCEMTGNVWEWVADWYDDDAYSSMESRDPDGPSDGTYKVLRGGSWSYIFSSSLDVAFRNYARPNVHNFHLGFRCVSAPNQQLKENLMSNPIRFDKYPKFATEEESERFSQLEKPKMYGGDVYKVTTTHLDVNGDGEDEVLGCGIYSSSVEEGSLEFRCSINVKQWFSVPIAYSRRSKVSEVRFGDIDLDGDIDIAYKMDGAIRVFHNLNTNN